MKEANSHDSIFHGYFLIDMTKYPPCIITFNVLHNLKSSAKPQGQI